ncbi:hypothetical protein X773_17980 [Mesorhizobium sp. LSJC285A00]|nr:hypothetical protein X773_17980 [Mesorhizobium sp. LSJC285A00]
MSSHARRAVDEVLWIDGAVGDAAAELCPSLDDGDCQRFGRTVEQLDRGNRAGKAAANDDD